MMERQMMMIEWFSKYRNQTNLQGTRMNGLYLILEISSLRKGMKSASFAALHV